MARDDFSKATIETIAKRVGYRCSICGAATTGPHSDQSKTVNIGVAAHITAASPNGPRYDPKLTTQERASPSNAIWLDQKCAKLIDSDTSRYTADQLRSLKEAAEYLAFCQLAQAPAAPFATLVFKDPLNFHGDRLNVDGGPDAVRRFMIEVRDNVENRRTPAFQLVFGGETALQRRAQELENIEQKTENEIEDYIAIRKRMLVYRNGKQQLEFIFKVFLELLFNLGINSDLDRSESAWNLIEAFMGRSIAPDRTTPFDLYRDQQIGTRVLLTKDEQEHLLSSSGLRDWEYLIALRGTSVSNLPRTVVIRQAAPLMALEIVLQLEKVGQAHTERYKELANPRGWRVGPA